MFILQEFLNPVKQGVVVENSSFARVVKISQPWKRLYVDIVDPTDLS